MGKARLTTGRTIHRAGPSGTGINRLTAGLQRRVQRAKMVSMLGLARRGRTLPAPVHLAAPRDL